MRFKSSDFQVDKDNPFMNDKFGRKPIVEFIVGIIDKAGGPFVLALDSPWGTGKTATVQMLKAYLENAGYLCVYFDAWRADYVLDPLVAMLGALDDLNFSKSMVAKDHFTTAKKLAGSIGRRLLVGGVRVASAGVVDLKEYEGVISEVASGATEDLVDAFNREQGKLHQLRDELEKAVRNLQKVDGNKKTLVFFVDELDRCRPDFALAVLERIKHLFDLADIHFVLSIDKKQLESSVNAVHGGKMNSAEYLRRFFDLEFGLPDGDSKIYTEFLVKDLGLDDYFSERTGKLSYDKDNFIDCFSTMADLFSLGLRAREKCLTRMVVVISQTPANHYLDPELTSFLIILRSVDSDYFKAIANGQVSTDDVSEYVRKKPGGNSFMNSHMGSVLYGMLIAQHSDREISVSEYNQLRHNYQVALGGVNPNENDWLETAVRIVEAHNARGGRRTIRLMAAKIDLSARLNS